MVSKQANKSEETGIHGFDRHDFMGMSMFLDSSAMRLQAFQVVVTCGLTEIMVSN
jgi:hypothetical protein